MIEIAGASARGVAERGRPRPILSRVTLRAERGTLAIVGAPPDGTALLFDLIDGTARPREGTVLVHGGSPDAMRRRVARVSLEQPLPDGTLRVDETCRLAADLRGEPSRPAAEILAVVGAGGLVARRVSSLGLEERRTVALAIALGSQADVLLIEEPLAALEPVSPRLVSAALRDRAKSATVVVTTTSLRDASALGDHLGRLGGGRYTAPPSPLAAAGSAAVRIVLSSSSARDGAARLAAVLARDDAADAVETAAFAAREGVPETATVLVRGADRIALATAVTRAVAEARVDVERIERMGGGS